MYIVRTQGYSKKNLEQRWGLPERVFFACGACHILAYVFLERYQMPNAKAVWIKPGPGFWGNHIFVAVDGWAFDYHGYSRSNALLDHTWKRARHFGRDGMRRLSSYRRRLSSLNRSRGPMTVYGFSSLSSSSMTLCHARTLT